MTFDQKTSLRLVGEALGLAHSLSDIAPIIVRSVYMIDGSLTVEVLATSDDPIRLRGQAASVMGGLSGLDPADLFPTLEFSQFAVRLVDERGHDVFWVISSPQDATFAEGAVVRWLANSIVQDNTPAYRRAQADRLIGQLEVALRDLLHYHWSLEHGNQYSSSVHTSTLVKDLRKKAGSEGEDEHDDRALLDFTMLPQLVRAVCSEALLVNHGCVVDATRLREDLTKLTKTRNKVAHHRPVSDQDLATIRSVVATVLQPVGEHHPDLTADFVADRWDDAVETLMSDVTSGMQTAEPPEPGTMTEPERRVVAAAMLEEQLAATKRGQTALDSLTVPPVRRSVDDLAQQAFHQLVNALEDLAAVARQDNLRLEDARAAQARHKAAMRDIRHLGTEIERIRVLEHAVE